MSKTRKVGGDEIDGLMAVRKEVKQIRKKLGSLNKAFPLDEWSTALSVVEKSLFDTAKKHYDLGALGP